MLQDRWIGMLLQLDRRVARAKLMVEVGLKHRLSTRVLKQALNHRARNRQQPASHLAYRTASVAREHTSTWTEAVGRIMAEMHGFLDVTVQARRGLRSNMD